VSQHSSVVRIPDQTFPTLSTVAVPACVDAGSTAAPVLGSPVLASTLGGVAADPWPTLPEDPGDAEADDGTPALGERLRQRRLFAEQEGVPWNG
jgi:hypothetical protein